MKRCFMGLNPDFVVPFLIDSGLLPEKCPKCGSKKPKNPPRDLDLFRHKRVNYNFYVYEVDDWKSLPMEEAIKTPETVEAECMYCKHCLTVLLAEPMKKCLATIPLTGWNKEK